MKLITIKRKRRNNMIHIKRNSNWLDCFTIRSQRQKCGFMAYCKGFALAKVLKPCKSSPHWRGRTVFDLSVRKSENRRGGEKETRKIAAFTLAEVLITLGIIGVLAALTIPT